MELTIILLLIIDCENNDNISAIFTKYCDDQHYNFILFYENHSIFTI